MNIGRSRRSSEATPPERGPKTAHPEERWQMICCPGGIWHALPGWRPGGVLPGVSLRSTPGYFLGCLRHRIEPRTRVLVPL